MRNNSALGLSKLVREYREKRGLTQKEMSRLLGYKTPQFVSMYELGKVSIPNKTLGKLIKILGIPERSIYKILLEKYKYELSKELFHLRNQKEFK